MFHFFWGLSLIIIITKEFLKHGPQAIPRRAGAKQHGQPAICKRFNQYLTVPIASENSMDISHLRSLNFSPSVGKRPGSVGPSGGGGSGQGHGGNDQEDRMQGKVGKGSYMNYVITFGGPKRPPPCM